MIVVSVVLEKRMKFFIVKLVMHVLELMAATSIAVPKYN
jgi:hypothetical protein